MDTTPKASTFAAERVSGETRIQLELRLSPGTIELNTGIGFLDHLLTSLAHHAGWSLSLTCEGDLEVDDHHSAEDVAITLGATLKEAAAERSPIVRFGSAFAPLDEALARAVVDFSGRPWAEVDLGLGRDQIGGIAAENVGHFLESFAANAGLCLHVDVLKGRNDHHRAEAAFKALALAMRQALAPSSFAVAGTRTAANSTKGQAVLSVSRREEGPEARGGGR